MYELKKIGKVFTSKFVRTGPTSYNKRIYQAAVSQRLRNTGLNWLAGLSNVHLVTHTMNAVYSWVLQSQIVFHTMAEAGNLLGWQTMSFGFASFIILSSGMDSIVGIATHYRLDRPRIKPQWRGDFPCQSRLFPTPTQPTIHQVQGLS